MRDIDRMQNQKPIQETAEQISLREKLKDVWRPVPILPELGSKGNVDVEIIDSNLWFIEPQDEPAPGIPIKRPGHFE